MIHSDRALVDALPEPDTGARLAPAGDFDEFFDVTFPLLVKVAMAVGANLEEAEDAAEDAMKYVYEHWLEINNHRAYARRVVVNAVAKAKGRDSERMARTIAGGYVTPNADDGTSLTAYEDQDWVMNHLRALPPAQREVIACAMDGMTSSEIADLLGKNPSTIRKNLQFARERLKNQLTEEQRHELHSEPSDHEATRRETR